MVSHDEVFLNNIVSKIFEMSDGKLNEYNLSYDDYLKQKDLEYEKDKLKYLNAIEENSPNFKNNDSEWIYSESDDSFELWCNGEYNSNNYSIQIKKYELDKEKELSDEYEL